jgi:hypothetical protein
VVECVLLQEAIYAELFKQPLLYSVNQWMGHNELHPPHSSFVLLKC